MCIIFENAFGFYQNPKIIHKMEKKTEKIE